MKTIFKLVINTSIVVLTSIGIYEIMKYYYNKIKNKKLYEKDVLDMMKDTPLIYIKSLSELTGCEIFVLNN